MRAFCHVTVNLHHPTCRCSDYSEILTLQSGEYTVKYNTVYSSVHSVTLSLSHTRRYHLSVCGALSLSARTHTSRSLSLCHTHTSISLSPSVMAAVSVVRRFVCRSVCSPQLGLQQLQHRTAVNTATGAILAKPKKVRE